MVGEVAERLVEAAKVDEVGYPTSVQEHQWLGATNNFASRAQPNFSTLPSITSRVQSCGCYRAGSCGGHHCNKAWHFCDTASTTPWSKPSRILHKCNFANSGWALQIQYSGLSLWS